MLGLSVVGWGCSDSFGGGLQPPEPPPRSAPEVHYSFDYAQQVHYPSDPLQPGPIYFLTPWKCTIFGVNCEAIPRQVNFLTDEAGDCVKGANAVVSRIHYFFAQHGETRLPPRRQLYGAEQKQLHDSVPHVACTNK